MSRTPEVNYTNNVAFSEYCGSRMIFEGVNLHPDKFSWTVGNGENERQIPVFSIWNYDHHAEIARMIGKGKAAAMYMWGTYGTAMLLNSPEWQEKGNQESATLRTKLKKDRPWGEKFANFMHPEDMIDFWDIDALHGDYRDLQWVGNRARLYELGPIHIIAPTKKRNPHLDSSLVREDDSTASYFYMPHPGWERVVRLLRKDVKHAVFGGGSLNFHKEEPGFRTETLYHMLSEKVEWQENIDLVVIDEIAENAQVFRSQTQIRLPKKNSDGFCEVVRLGGIRPTTWARQFGYPVKDATEGVKQASSETSYSFFNNLTVEKAIVTSRKQMVRYDQMVKSNGL